MRKKENEKARAAAQLILIAFVCALGIPGLMSRVIHYEAIPHVEAKVEPHDEPVPVKPVELRRGETQELLQHLFAEAERYGADPEKMRRTIACETANTWDASIQSGYRRPNGTRELSFGLAQIHLPDWPDITIDQAKDPYFAISFMAEHFGENEGALWSCYRHLYGRSASNI